MEHQTTIGIYDNGEETSKEQYLNNIDVIMKTVLKKNIYNLCLKIDGNWIAWDDLPGIEKAFTDFRNYIVEHGEDDEDGTCIINNNNPEYQGNPIDVEGGDIEFERSFNISDGIGFAILFSTEHWYASDINKLPDMGLELSGDMNDIDGDYYEFEV